VLAQRYGPVAQRRIRRVGALAVLLPWSAALLWLGAPLIAHSLAQLEGFPESLNPGYFVVKLAMGLMLLLQGLQAAITAFESGR
ncbi:MAG: hypothetical protein HY021_06600, partial [Burkholderiales bacterium]|nr:hypothetical protein [Burkholderiales bacterium]